MGYPERLAGGFLRAGISEETLARRGDMWGLYARTTSEQLFGTADSTLVNASNALATVIGLRVADYVDTVRGKVLISGPLRLYPESSCEGAVLLPRKVGQAVLDMGPEHIGVRFYGEQRDVPGLTRHLGKLAHQLARRANNPEMMIGVSSRDVIAMAAELLPGVATYTVEGYQYADDVLAFADAARQARGRPPLSDRGMYAIAMPTGEFTGRFAA